MGRQKKSMLKTAVTGNDGVIIAFQLWGRADERRCNALPGFQG
jgi:hypothetical protein